MECGKFQEHNQTFQRENNKSNKNIISTDTLLENSQALQCLCETNNLLYTETMMMGKFQAKNYLNDLKLLKTGLTMNATKCEYNKTEIQYLEHTFSKNGVSLDPQN